MIPDTILTALSTMAKSFGKHFTSLKESIDALPKKLDISESVNKQTAVLAKAIERLERVAGREQKVSTNVKFDTTELRKELKSVADELRGLAAVYETPDFRTMEAKLSDLQNVLESSNAAQMETMAAINDLASAVAGIKLNVPGTVKLDKDQFGILAQAGGGGGIGSINQASTTTIANIAATNTNTQYTYTFPARTIRFSIKLRDLGTLAYYSWNTGKLPTVGGGGDGSNYVTISQGFVRVLDAEYGGKTIYLGAESANQVFEIESYSY